MVLRLRKQIYRSRHSLSSLSWQCKHPPPHTPSGHQQNRVSKDHTDCDWHQAFLKMPFVLLWTLYMNSESLKITTTTKKSTKFIIYWHCYMWVILDYKMCKLSLFSIRMLSTKILRNSILRYHLSHWNFWNLYLSVYFLWK